MIKRNFIKFKLHLGESLNREDFADCNCLPVISGSFVVLNSKGEVVLRLRAGEVNVMTGHYEFTGTAVENDTEVIIV